MKYFTVLIITCLLNFPIQAGGVRSPKKPKSEQESPMSESPKHLFSRLPEFKAGALWNDNKLKMKFRWCPPGSYLMGSPNEEFNGHALGQVPVKLTKGFWIGETEVSQKQWQSLMGNTVQDQRDREQAELTKGVADDPAKFGKGDRFPMYFVSWEEAMQFCQKLTEADRKSGKLPADWEYTLPTEAQWEYACRAGTTTATAFGDLLSSHQANFDGDHPYTNINDKDLEDRAPEGPDRRHAVPVGSFRPNGWNLYDMHGNLQEWCRDWYNEKMLLGGTDPEVTEKADFRVLRGGSWLHTGAGCLSCYRFYDIPGSRTTKIGFRVALVQIPVKPGKKK